MFAFFEVFKTAEQNRPTVHYHLVV